MDAFHFPSRHSVFQAFKSNWLGQQLSNLRRVQRRVALKLSLLSAKTGKMIKQPSSVFQAPQLNLSCVLSSDFPLWLIKFLHTFLRCLPLSVLILSLQDRCEIAFVSLWLRFPNVHLCIDFERLRCHTFTLGRQRSSLLSNDCYMLIWRLKMASSSPSLLVEYNRAYIVRYLLKKCESVD